MKPLYKVKWYPDGKPSGRAKHFAESLEGQCKSKFDKLTWYLGRLGWKLGEPMFKRLTGDVWELIDDCDRGALRIYGFTDGTTYYMTCGEYKKRNKPGPGLIKYAQRCCDEHKEKNK